jgi:NAD(P)-dependent dehydrogenase (short-subunit alcohol dehydrogenase family)
MNLVITGSSSGIGRALTEHLLGRGHRVLGLARSRQDDLIGSYPENFRAAQGDVAIWPDLERIATGAGQIWSHLDGLVTCAGVQGEIGRAVTADPARWSATVRTNLDGTYHAIRAFHALLSKAPGRAKIICFSGGGATKARANFSAYGAAKTGVVRLVETIAEEERNAPLDINAIAPGAINTRLTDEVIALGPEIVGSSEYQAALKQKSTGGGSLAKAVGLVEWLLSSASDGVSGRLLSAPWDPWSSLDIRASELAKTDIYTLRRIVPEDRGVKWS